MNQLQKETAEEAIAELADEIRGKIRFINRKVDKTFY